MRDETAFKQTAMDERETLRAFLAFHQDTLPMKLNELSEAELFRPMVESGSA